MSRFVDRNEKGLVCGTYACRQREDQEELPDEHVDLQDFEKRIANPDLNLDFPEFVVTQVKKLDAIVLEFVYERYPQHRQITLSKLLTDSRLAGNKPAQDYMEQCDNWLKTVFGAYYQLEDQITGIAKDEKLSIALRQIQIIDIIKNARASTLELLSVSDPKVTIRRSLELLQS
jgi:hypothetical protein